MHRLTLGDFELSVFSDGTYPLDGGAFFGVIPKVMWSRKMEADERNYITSGLNSLLVRTGKQTVLIETGMGNKLSERMIKFYGQPAKLLDNLAAAGVAHVGQGGPRLPRRAFRPATSRRRRARRPPQPRRRRRQGLSSAELRLRTARLPICASAILGTRALSGANTPPESMAPWLAIVMQASSDFDIRCVTSFLALNPRRAASF